MNGLQALKRIRQETCPATYMSDFDKNECCDIIEKELKALEIIAKRFTIQFIKSDFLPNYYGIMQIGITPIYIKTKEEYDLLKEVML